MAREGGRAGEHTVALMLSNPERAQYVSGSGGVSRVLLRCSEAVKGSCGQRTRDQGDTGGNWRVDGSRRGRTKRKTPVT